MKQRAQDAENSLERIKRQLASGSGRNLLQGPLLKRSETVRSLTSLSLLRIIDLIANDSGFDFSSKSFDFSVHFRLIFADPFFVNCESLI